jgi:ribosomal protein S12 methylthiotransferase accessory factor
MIATYADLSRNESQPVMYCGTAHRSRKGFWHGTHRICPPSETLMRISPHFPRLGLTRLANVTGLDRIGIHTVLSVRPNSRYLSVDAGKGFTLDAAMVSAGMECIERYHGENAPVPSFRASHTRVAEEHVAIPHDRLPLLKHGVFSPNLPVSWSLGWDLLHQCEVAVPTALVLMSGQPVRRPDLIPFQRSSNGLAAGNDLLEAIDGGLLELIERDGVACHRVAAERHRADLPRVDQRTIEHPFVLDLLARLAAVEMFVILYDCSVDTGVPIYMAYLCDESARHGGIFRGYGAHLDPAIAMVRAITEAVQGRLVFIAGSRDDVLRQHHTHFRQVDDTATVRALRDAPATVDARERRDLSTGSFEGDVNVLLNSLRAAGLDQVIVFDLSMPEFGVAAVRVLVPGLEGYMFESYSPGARARAFVRQRGIELGAHA